MLTLTLLCRPLLYGTANGPRQTMLSSDASASLSTWLFTDNGTTPWGIEHSSVTSSCSYRPADPAIRLLWASKNTVIGVRVFTEVFFLALSLTFLPLSFSQVVNRNIDFHLFLNPFVGALKGINNSLGDKNFLKVCDELWWSVSTGSELWCIV